MIVRYSPASLAAALCLVWALPRVEAIWPFKSKRFVAEELIDAGDLGLGDVGGRVIGVGDWDGDQSADLFTLSKDGRSLQVSLWDKTAFKYLPGPTHTATDRVLNVIPADWNHDGRLDVLLVTGSEEGGWWGGDSKSLKLQVLLGGPDGQFGETWDLEPSTATQPFVFDADGSLKPSLLGYPSVKGGKESLKSWRNTGKGLSVKSAPLIHPDRACTLAEPHSSAYVDMDGDCVPDLILHCAESKSGMGSIQIWLNRGEEGYELGKTIELPKGAGPLSFADMNRDGTIDIIFPVCSKHSESSGVGTGCSINIAYNLQIPLCSSEGSTRTSSGELKCRGWGELCIADKDFHFDLSSSSSSFTSLPLSSISQTSSILLSVPEAPHIPLPLRPGDFQHDGYPDLLLAIVNSTARSGGVFSDHQGTQARVLLNVPCSKGVAGCEGGQKRTFRMARGKGWDVLNGMNDVVGASWIDIDDDGTLDLMVQRTGEQGKGQVTFVQNNFYHDAFFLKAQVLNGACDGECVSGGKRYSGLGGVSAGGSYKFTVLDTLGRRDAQHVPQLPQSAYHALELPYAYIGLGRTNNYIERLTAGVSLHSNNITDLDSIIPNSQVTINPPIPLALSSPDPDADQSSMMREWHAELFLRPGDWVPWVGASVIGTVLALGGVVWFLHGREKREDEYERRRALHAINFQAL